MILLTLPARLRGVGGWCLRARRGKRRLTAAPSPNSRRLRGAGPQRARFPRGAQRQPGTHTPRERRRVQRRRAQRGRTRRGWRGRPQRGTGCGRRLAAAGGAAAACGGPGAAWILRTAPPAAPRCRCGTVPVPQPCANPHSVEAASWTDARCTTRSPAPHLGASAAAAVAERGLDRVRPACTWHPPPQQHTVTTRERCRHASGGGIRHGHA